MYYDVTAHMKTKGVLCPFAIFRLLTHKYLFSGYEAVRSNVLIDDLVSCIQLKVWFFNICNAHLFRCLLIVPVDCISRPAALPFRNQHLFVNKPTENLANIRRMQIQ